MCNITRLISLIIIVCLLNLDHGILAQQWLPLNAGLNSTCSALSYTANGDLYAVGEFGGSGSIPAQRVAKWDGLSWSALGSGITGDYIIDVLADDFGNVYVGGQITSAGGIPINNIAKWDGTSWSTLGGGVNGPCDALIVDGNGDLIVGGYFTMAGGIPANNIAKWNGTSWSPIGTGIDGSVQDFLIDSAGILYACGNFTMAGGISANNIAQWDGTSWSALGSGLNLAGFTIKFDDDENILVGGDFTIAGGIPASYIAKWDGVSWSALGNGFDDRVLAIEVISNDEIIAGGLFSNWGGIPTNHIAKWDGNSWTELHNGLGGGSGHVSSIVKDNLNNLFVGGDFNIAGSNPIDNIAYYQELRYFVKTKSFYDLNGNSIWDANEIPFQYGKLICTLGPPYNTSALQFVDSSGNGTIGFPHKARIDFSYVTQNTYYNISISKNFTDFTNGNCDSICVAITPNTVVKDLRITIAPDLGRSGFVRPGAKSSYLLTIENVGTQAISNPMAIVYKNHRQLFTSTSLTPVSVRNNRIIWILPTMQPLDKVTISYCVMNDNIPILNIGDNIQNIATIWPLMNDGDLGDNQSSLTQLVQAAYDPNDKNESHNGIISSQQATDQEWLNYNIRFQNTGTDTAFNVIVRDTLDDNVDGTTLQMQNTSHSSQLEILNGKYLAWKFNEIDLVDSNASEPLSHGFINYRIKPIAGLVLNDIIENSASIYFDYNPPITTNTHVTTVLDDLNCLTCKDNSLHFDGIDDYVQASSPFVGNSDYTIEVWVDSENTSVGSTYHRIIGWQNFQMELADVAGDLQFYDGVVWINTGINIRDAQWHHVAVTREGGSYKVYVDGNLELDYQRNNTLNLTGTFRLGSKVNTFNEMWKGRIDDVRMWDYARAADKIMAKRFCALSGTPDGLVLHYSFDQGIAAGNNVGETTLVDITEGSQNGTLNAFTLMGATSNYVVSTALDENYCLEGTIAILQEQVLIYEDINCVYETSSNYTTIEMDYGDGNTAVLLSSAGFKVHEYQLPGMYNVSLLLDGKCVATQQILVETCEWQAYTEDFNLSIFDQYHGSCAFILPSTKTAYLDPTKTSLSDYKTSFVNYQPYGILANNIIYSVVTQNTTSHGGISPNQTELILAGRNGHVAVTFANDLASTKIIAPGINSNSIASLNINTTNWHTLAIKITNDQDIDILVDHSVVHSFIINKPLQEVIGLEVKYHGSGTAELIQLSKSPNTMGDYLNENFVSCEQTCPCVYSRHIDYPELAHEVRTYVTANIISGDNIINSDATIVYNAANEIELQENFQAQRGAEFETKSEGCTLYCNTINPLFDLNFLQIYVGNPLYKITHCKWNGQSVFQVSYCNSSNGTDSYFYDCTGYLICHALSPSDPCFVMFNFTNCEVLQGC